MTRPLPSPDVSNRPKQSLHQTILDDIRGKILSGEWGPGTQLPFEQDLARDYGCSRMTVNKVMTQLAASGLVERRRKAGTFVRRPQSYSAIMQIADIRHEVEALGLAYHYEILKRQVRPSSPSETSRFKGPVTVLDIHCRHFAARRPFCFENRQINLEAVPDAEHEEFDEQSPGAWLVSRIPWSDADYHIRAVAADDAIARSLLIAPGAPCLWMERRTENLGETVTLVSLTYPGSDHQVMARFSSRPY